MTPQALFSVRFVGHVTHDGIHILDDRPRFVIALEDPEAIAHARRVIDFDERERIHVRGRVRPYAVEWNPHWPFHLDPASVSFFAGTPDAAEDADLDVVVTRLDEVGGAFLPAGFWAPGHSTLVRELMAVG